jgi:hypothetical protein
MHLNPTSTVLVKKWSESGATHRVLWDGGICGRSATPPSLEGGNATGCKRGALDANLVIPGITLEPLTLQLSVYSYKMF